MVTFLNNNNNIYNISMYIDTCERIRRNSGGAVILTCKSFDFFGERDERQTSPGKANDWRNREHVVLDLFSNPKMGKIPRVLW